MHRIKIGYGDESDLTSTRTVHILLGSKELPSALGRENKMDTVQLEMSTMLLSVFGPAHRCCFFLSGQKIIRRVPMR